MDQEEQFPPASAAEPARSPARHPQTARRHAPEIVIAFIAPTATNRDLVLGTAEQLLHGFEYETVLVRLSSVLDEIAKSQASSERGTGRTWRLQDAGNDLCRSAGRADAMAFVAVDQIRKERARLNRERADSHNEGTPEVADNAGSITAPETAYLIWSLKRPAEVEALRAIYRSRLFVVSVYTPYATRLSRLVNEEADAVGHITAEQSDRESAIKLLERDERETRIALPTDPPTVISQNVSDTYPLADFFVDASSRESISATLERSIGIIFGDPFATPTRSEYGMFIAHAAALKSAELGRQVGAAIATTAGDVIAAGTNEVPKPGGGHYWTGDVPDRREVAEGIDTSVRLRNRLISQVVEAVDEAGAAEQVGVEEPSQSVAATLLSRLAKTRLGDIIEFGRPAHAEMSALTDAARLGRSVDGCVMYVTTFPCHLCTRLIIAAGIVRLEYIYPYPKSLSDELYDRLIDTGRGRPLDKGALPFMPFIGVAPRRYSMAFTAPAMRKEISGEVVRKPARSPRLLIEDETGEWDLSTHVVREDEVLNRAAWLKEVFERSEKEGS